MKSMYNYDQQVDFYDVETDLYFAHKIIDGGVDDTNRFSNYSHIYRFTNEPMNSYAKYLKDRERVLSVTGSGDQVLKCIAYGTKKVDTFDISHFPKYFLDMKLAAAKNLSRDEFYSMFYSNDFIETEKHNKYSKFREDLPMNSRYFWDCLMNSYSWGTIYSSRLFTARNSLNFVNDKSKMLEHYSFLQDEEYEMLKENAKKAKVNSFISDVSEVSSKVEGSYDLVFLSNLCECVPVPKFKEYIKNLKVNENGIMLNLMAMACYGNKYSDYELLKQDGFAEEKTDRLARLLVKKF